MAAQTAEGLKRATYIICLPKKKVYHLCKKRNIEQTKKNKKKEEEKKERKKKEDGERKNCEE